MHLVKNRNEHKHTRFELYVTADAAVVILSSHSVFFLCSTFNLMPFVCSVCLMYMCACHSLSFSLSPFSECCFFRLAKLFTLKSMAQHCMLITQKKKIYKREKIHTCSGYMRKNVIKRIGDANICREMVIYSLMLN